MDQIFKDLPSNTSTKEDRSNGYWRFVHGFDSIEENPKGWPIINRPNKIRTVDSMGRKLHHL